MVRGSGTQQSLFWYPCESNLSWHTTVFQVRVTSFHVLVWIHPFLCFNHLVGAQFSDWILSLSHFHKCRSWCACILSSGVECLFLIAPILLACFSCQVGECFLNKRFEYSFYLLFEYCLHSFIIYQNLWTPSCSLTPLVITTIKTSL